MSLTLTGACTCKQVRFTVSLDSVDDARTSLCHCSLCKRAFGTPFGLTTKIPLSTFQYTSGDAKKYQQDNGVIREFCGNCGVFICEYGKQAADKFRYIMWGAFDEADKVPPKGEFFCRQREPWMPEIQGVFHKQEIKE